MKTNTKFRTLLLSATLTAGLGTAWAGFGNGWNENNRPAPTLVGLLNQEIVAELALDEGQQAALAQIRQQSQRTLEQLQLEMSALRQRLDRELAKPVPDLRRAIEEGLEQRQATVIGAIDQAREVRLDFYDSLSPEQKRLVADRIESRLARIDRLRQLIGHLLLGDSTR